ncbi:hypothetical protein B5M09_008938 [Aphanomyces astaci]|uniref:Uncharacterized protein n=1 Tax=Aphanomyces astaci TaxID=112090 RepID=A0A3R7XU71_APHAT|nr:hypothetical protein B5M09_008938 [Aphanomyces astaci]
MKTASGYQVVKVGKISDAKLKKALKGGSLTLSAAELKPNDYSLLLHPENAKKVIAAQKANKGTRIQIARGEVEHNNSELQGGSIFSSIWNFLNGNATPLLDIAANVATPFVGPAVATGARELARSITGKGLSSSSSGGRGPHFPKGSPEMKAKMAALRAKRKTKTLQGASFRLA